MTPDQLLAALQNTTEFLDWILRLVPPGGGGSDLSSLPAELDRQSRRLGIVDGTFIDRLRSLIHQTDWVRDEFDALLSQCPVLRQACHTNAGIAAGAVNDAEFNGHVYRCRSSEGVGYVITLSAGTILLVSSAAEMLMLLADTSLCEALAGARMAPRKQTEPWLLRTKRRLARFFDRPHLADKFAGRIGWEFGELINRYVHLGTPDTPSIIGDLGAIPFIGEWRRWGHPLEAGSNLRFFAIRFLLLHECGHVIAGHLSPDDPAAADHFETEFAADDFAFRQLIGSASRDDVAVAGALGAWLVLTLSARIEDLSDEPAPRSHPPARERLGRLRAYLTSLNDKLPMTHAVEVLNAITKFEALLFETARSDGVFTRGSPLSLFLLQCAKTGQHKMFYDQLPRWLLFGAPSRLCQELASLRVCMERRIEKDGRDVSAREQLALINWVFDVASTAPNNFLSRKLLASYDRAQTGRKGL